MRSAGLVVGGSLRVAAALLLLASIVASIIVAAMLFSLISSPELGAHALVATLLAAFANALLYAIAWALNKVGRKYIERSASRDLSRVGRVPGRLYGAILVLFGILLGAFVVYEIFRPPSEPWWMLVTHLLLASFVAVGAVAIGFQRMTGRRLGRLEKFVKPDDWLLQKYGPKGPRPAQGTNTNDDRGPSGPQA